MSDIGILAKGFAGAFHGYGEASKQNYKDQREFMLWDWKTEQMRKQNLEKLEQQQANDIEKIEYQAEIRQDEQTAAQKFQVEQKQEERAYKEGEADRVAARYVDREVKQLSAELDKEGLSTDKKYLDIWAEGRKAKLANQVEATGKISEGKLTSYQLAQLEMNMIKTMYPDGVVPVDEWEKAQAAGYTSQAQYMYDQIGPFVNKYKTTPEKDIFKANAQLEKITGEIARDFIGLNTREAIEQKRASELKAAQSPVTKMLINRAADDKLQSLDVGGKDSVGVLQSDGVSTQKSRPLVSFGKDNKSFVEAVTKKDAAKGLSMIDEF